MHQRWQRSILIAIVLLVIALRLILAFQEPLPSYAAYAELRQVQHIKETGAPLVDDPLSYEGRTRVASPFYSYILTCFSLFMPDEVMIKLVPNLFAALIVFPAFALALLLTDDQRFALIGAGLAGLTPALFLVSSNDGSPTGLTLTLMLTAAFFFLKARRKGKYVQWCIATIVAMTLIQPLSVIFLLGLAFFLLLWRLEVGRVQKKDVEIFLFTLFFTSWYMLIIFKQAFQIHGSRVIWQNIPTAHLASTFSQVTLLSAITSIGLVGLIAGAVAAYDGLTKTRRKPIALLASMVVAAGLLTWFKLVALKAGLALLGVLLAILSAYGLQLLVRYVQKTKLARFSWWIIGIILLIAITATLPMLVLPSASPTPGSAELDVLTWARDHLDAHAVMLASPTEGSFIAYVGQVQNVADDDYLLIPRVEERMSDMREAYRSFFTTDALSVMQKYGVTYILVSPMTVAFTGVEQPRFTEDKTCFALVAQANDTQGAVQLYKRTCHVAGET